MDVDSDSAVGRARTEDGDIVALPYLALVHINRWREEDAGDIHGRIRRDRYGEGTRNRAMASAVLAVDGELVATTRETSNRGRKERATIGGGARHYLRVLEDGNGATGVCAPGEIHGGATN